MAEEKLILTVQLKDSDLKKKSSDLEVSIQDITKQNKQLNESFKAGKITQDQFARATTENKRKLKELRSEQRVYDKVVSANGKSLDGLRAKLSLLTRQANQLDLNSEEFDKLQQEIKQVNEEISGFEQARGDFRRNVGNYASALDPLLGGFGRLGELISGALGPAAIAAGVAAGIAGLARYQQQLEKTRQQVNLLTGAIGNQLNRTTASVQAIADTFDQDFNEALTSANAIANGFNISLDESTDLLTKGFAAGANSTGELLAITREYTPLLKEMGLTADQAFSIITQQVKSGVYTDKGIDAIKEAGLRLRELTPASRDALDLIGLSSKEIEVALRDGTVSMLDVVRQVSARLDELPPQSAAVGTAIADVFGGPGEDAGLAFIKTLKDIDDDFDDVIESAGEFATTQLRLANANRELQLIFNETLGGADGLLKNMEASAKEFIVNGLRAIINTTVDVINFFRELHNESLIFRAVVNSFSVAFTSFGETVGLVFDLIVQQFRTTGDLFQAIITGNFGAIPGIIKDGFDASIDEFKESARNIGQAVFDGITETITPKDLLAPVVFGSNEEFEAARGLGMAAGQAFSSGVAEGLDEAKRAREAFLKLALLQTEENTSARLEAEIALLEFERAEKLKNDQLTANERLLIEAEFRAAMQDRLTEFYEFVQEQREKDLEHDQLIQEQREQAEFEINQSRLATATDVTGAILEVDQRKRESNIELLEEQLKNDKTLTDAQKENLQDRINDERKALKEREGIALIALILQKAAAVAEIGLNLQQELAANAVAGAKISASAPPATIPIGVTYTQTRNIAAIVRAAVAAGTIAATTLFDEGGDIAFEGGKIPFAGGMIQGRSHAEGGVKFSMGARIGEADGKKGEAYIINTMNSPVLKKLASDLNVMGGGKSFYDQGGVVRYQSGGVSSLVRNASLSADREAFTTREFERILRELPRPVVFVDDIDTGLSRKTEVEERATI